ncbi:hypothetical protein Ahy_A06g029958 [Arachis hypogaea]|uniref:Zinc finger GRF-type domain-containing protein n=1 Tax=Arachis hypogaea TaxID=3818 RepID=A0A445CUQ9_ARAHY|nr:hypothetical protein Ahy_A06g029958 [Arachis hypogaea]
MGSVTGGRSRSLSQSHGRNGSSSSLRIRRKNMDQICFCGLKTVIKKSGTVENLDKFFYVCPRYWKDSHCNYFKRVENNEYEGLNGANENDEIDVEVESDLVD